MLAVRALGDLRDGRLLPILRALLQEASLDVREAAAEALGKLGDPQVLPDLVARLQDPAALVRRRVAWAIGEIAVQSADAAG